MYIGVDIGGTKVAIGIIDKGTNVIYHKLILTKKEREVTEVINDVIQLIKESITKSSKDNFDIKTIGIGIPGQVDAMGNIIQCVNLDWYDIPLKKIIEEEVNLPVYIDNDASLAALAEYEVGAMKNTHSGIMLTLGTGIGGGIIINGKIHNGFHGVGSEIGHMVIGRNFYRCNCGKNGCFETFASATALKKYTNKLLEKDESQLIEILTGGNINKLNGQIIFEAAYKGDEIAIRSINRFIKYLGIGIVNLVNIFDPEIFVLGGGLSKSGPFLLEKIKKEVKDNKLIKTLPIGDIVLAELGNQAGFIGAALLAKYRNQVI